MWEKAISLTSHGEVECQHVLVIAVHSSARDVQACDEGPEREFRAGLASLHGSGLATHRRVFPSDSVWVELVV